MIFSVALPPACKSTLTRQWTSVSFRPLATFVILTSKSNDQCPVKTEKPVNFSLLMDYIKQKQKTLSIEAVWNWMQIRNGPHRPLVVVMAMLFSHTYTPRWVPHQESTLTWPEWVTEERLDRPNEQQYERVTGRACTAVWLHVGPWCVMAITMEV